MAYATVADVRALDGLADTTVYPDATLQQGIDFATKLIDGYCGTSFEAKTFSVTLDGNGSGSLYLGVLFPLSLTSVTFDGVAQTVGDFIRRPEGVLVSKVGVFPWSPFGSNVVVAGTAGVTSTPDEDIKWSCRTIARQYALDLHSRLPDRALTVQSEFGQVEVRAQAGGPGRPTSMPEVNARLNANKHKPGNAAAVFT